MEENGFERRIEREMRGILTGRMNEMCWKTPWSQRKDSDLHGYSNVILFLEKNELWAARTVNDKVNWVDYIDIKRGWMGSVGCYVEDCKGWWFTGNLYNHQEEKEDRKYDEKVGWKKYCEAAIVKRWKKGNRRWKWERGGVSGGGGGALQSAFPGSESMWKPLNRLHYAGQSCPLSQVDSPDPDKSNLCHTHTAAFA